MTNTQHTTSRLEAAREARQLGKLGSSASHHHLPCMLPKDSLIPLVMSSSCSGLLIGPLSAPAVLEPLFSATPEPNWENGRFITCTKDNERITTQVLFYGSVRNMESLLTNRIA